MIASPNAMRSRFWRITVSALLLLAFGLAGLCSAQEGRNVDLDALGQDLRKSSRSPDQMTMVTWFPEEYWRATLENSPDATAVQREQFIKVLRPYIVMLVVDGKLGPMGGITFESESAIRGSIELIDSQGKSHRPLGDEAISADAKNLLSMAKPVFANALGRLGQNVHFVLFPARAQDGGAVVDPRAPGTLTVKLPKSEFKWRLPLGSLVPPKVCPIDGETMDGAWKFCPWHGVELKSN